MIQQIIILAQTKSNWQGMSEKNLWGLKSCRNKIEYRNCCRTGGMADAEDSKSSARKGVPVQVRGSVILDESFPNKSVDSSILLYFFSFLGGGFKFFFFVVGLMACRGNFSVPSPRGIVYLKCCLRGIGFEKSI